jgi:HAD superfamily hydrolase (TIGR01509 family)
MRKAFIFDMDGVIINSESVWARYEKKFMPQLMGWQTYREIKNDILGNSVSNIYDKAQRMGFKMPKDKFLRIYFRYAKIVYKKAKLTSDINELIIKLVKLNFKIGLVSVSRQDWIDLVLDKLKIDYFNLILSLDSQGLKAKPDPEGYIKAMRTLGIRPKNTIILEDSEKGIKAAKASGALAICLRENLPNNYLPKGADLYVKNIQELINKIEDIKI